MADHKNLKRLIRARMRKTGESYTAARAHVLKAGQTSESPAPATSEASRPEAVQQGSIFPFERFTDAAKQVLTRAQEEAQRARHSYIGTEHILLGILLVDEGTGAKVLKKLGLDVNEVRATIESVLGRNERIIIQQIIPTSRVKKTIEIAFEEARGMGDNFVGTEHLLLGLLVEGEGIAAHVLEDLGASLEVVRAELAQVVGGPGATPTPPIPHKVSLGLVVQKALDDARAEHASMVSPVHLLQALVTMSHGPAHEILLEAGLTPEFVARRLAELEAEEPPRHKPAWRPRAPEG